MKVLLITSLLLWAAGDERVAIGPGDHLFLQSAVAECGGEQRFTHHATVDQFGQARFADGIAIWPMGQTETKIKQMIVGQRNAMAAAIPAEFEIVIVPDNKARIARFMLDQLYAPERGCNLRSPRPDIETPPQKLEGPLDGPSQHRVPCPKQPSKPS